MEQTEIEMNRVHNHSQPSSQPSSQPAGGNEGGKKLWQVIGAMSANLFAVCMGSTMGWTSAAAKLQQKNETGLVVSADSYSWIGAAMPLGAMLAAIPASRAMERWGRKRTLLVLSTEY